MLKPYSVFHVIPANNFIVQINKVCNIINKSPQNTTEAEIFLYI